MSFDKKEIKRNATSGSRTPTTYGGSVRRPNYYVKMCLSHFS